jgi:hypothetical protein
MGNVFNALILILFVISYALLIVPAFLILFIADAIKEKRPVRLFDSNIFQKLEA